MFPGVWGLSILVHWSLRPRSLGGDREVTALESKVAESTDLESRAQESRAQETRATDFTNAPGVWAIRIWGLGV